MPYLATVVANVVATSDNDPEGWQSVEPDRCWLAMFIGDVLELLECYVTTNVCLDLGRIADQSSCTSR